MHNLYATTEHHLRPCLPMCVSVGNFRQTLVKHNGRYWHTYELCVLHIASAQLLFSPLTWISTDSEQNEFPHITAFFICSKSCEFNMSHDLLLNADLVKMAFWHVNDMMFHGMGHDIPAQQLHTCVTYSISVCNPSFHWVHIVTK